jgi:phosphoribosylamine--glycine ligase
VDEAGIVRAGAELFYASVEEKDRRIVTTTSRALAVVGIEDSIPKAEAVCEAGLRHVRGDVYLRHDIGTAESIRRKGERMRRLRGK